MERVDPYPLIWVAETMSHHQPSKTRLPPKCRDKWRGWVTHVRIDENPVKGVHDLCFDKTCQETASRYVWSWLKKNGSNNHRAMA